MKKLFIILFTLYGAIAMAQGPGVPKPSNYTWIAHRYDWLSGKFRGLHVPAGTTPALIDGQYTGAGALFVDSVNHRFYFYSGGNWRYAGGIDSVTYETDSTFIWQSGNSFGIPSGATTLQQIFDQENGRAVLSQVDTVDMNDNKLLFYSGDDLKYYFGLETFQAIIDPGTGGSAGLTISEYGLFSNMFGSSGNFGRIWMDLATESTKSTFRIIADSVQFDISRGSPLSIADSASNYMVVMDKATGHLRAAYWPIGGSGTGGFFGDETNSGGATTKDGNGEDYTITGVDTFSLSGNSIYLSPVDSLMLENISVDGEGETPEEITNLLGITGTGKVKAAPDYFGRFGTDGDPIATANRAFNLQENQLIIAGSEDDNGSSFKINPYEVNLHSSYLTGGVRLLFQDGETGSLHGETGAGNSGFFVDITDTDNPEVEVKSHGNINLEATLSGKQISLNTPTYLFQFPDITDNSGHIYVNKQFQRGTSSQVVYYDSTAQEFLWGPAPSGGGGFFTSSSSTGNTTQDGEGDVFRLIDVSEFGIRATSSGSLDRFRVDATSTVMVSNEGNAFISASDQQIDLDATNVVVSPLAGSGAGYVAVDNTGKLSWSAGSGGGGSPGGSNTQIQYNNSSAFGGSSLLTWDNADTTLGIGDADIYYTADDAGGFGLSFGGIRYMHVNYAPSSSIFKQGNTFLGYNAGALTGSTGSSGLNNTFIGGNSGELNTSGQQNTALGSRSLVSNTTGVQNTAIGQGSFYSATTVSQNAGLGFHSGLNVLGANNTFIGTEAGEGAASATAAGNTAVGNLAMNVVSSGANNAALGRYALGSLTTSGNNTSIGTQSGFSVLTGNGGNSFLGYQAGYETTTGTYNTAIGAAIQLPSATANGQLNIGNVLYGSNLYQSTTRSSSPTTLGSIGIGLTTPTARLHLPAGTTTASTAPLKFTSGTHMTTPENGAVEYDGSHLYVTIGGSRYQLDQQAGTISDGDKGDIVISSSATVYTIDDAAVEMNDINATGTPSGSTYLRGDGTWSTLSGAGITSLGGQTGGTQTFAIGTTAQSNNLGWVSGSDVHTLHVPDASATVRGVVTTGTQTFAGNKTLSGFTFLTGGFASNTSSATSNLYTFAGGAGGTLSTTAGYLTEGASGSVGRVAMLGSTNYTIPTASYNYHSFSMGEMAVTEAGSGTHPLIAGMLLKAPTITNGAGATANAATLYISGAPTGITPTDQLNSAWIASGNTRFGKAGTATGTISFEGATSGRIGIQPASAAGSYTLTLPTTDGNSGEVLTTDGSGVLSWAAGGGGGANTALSNLASVAINASLISDADNTDDLGSSANAWKDAYMYSLKLKGSSSGTATITPLSAAGTTSIYLPTSNGHLVNFFSANESGSVSAPASWGGARTNLYNLSGLSSNATFAAPGGTPLDGNLLYIRVQDNGTSRTLAWNAIFDEGDDLPLPTSTVTGKGMRLQFSYNDATSKWELIGYTGGF
jgi:hypothetical protein